jgi:hypothetical protein
MYKCVLSDAVGEGIPLALGGGLASSLYGGSLRDGRDMDLYIEHGNLDRMKPILTRNGLNDYFAVKPYDRNWIYRSYFRETIVDVMWAMANQRAQVDRTWLAGPDISVDGLTIRFLPPEQTLWTKLYVLQFDRCDWPDALNILYTSGAEFDWDRMLQLVGEDVPLLAALLSIFRWIAPGIAAKLPVSLWSRVGLGEQHGGPDYLPKRADLLDSRAWLIPMLGGQNTC